MKTNFHKSGRSLIWIIIVFIAVGLISGGIYYCLQKQITQTAKIVQKINNEITKPSENATLEKITPKPEPEKSIIKKCTDGTPYGQCSSNKPKYCDNGNLIDKCIICSCFLNQYCDNPSGLCKEVEKLDMLILVSPQYANDASIRQAINEYINGVKNDLNWDTKVIIITPDINDFRKIDEIIEDYYNKSAGRLKASIMVGEDIDTALKHDYIGRECPSTVPWYTIGEESYTYPNTGVESPNSEMKVVISLLYPAHDLDYKTKSNQIISVFKKFNTNRDKKSNKISNVFISSVDFRLAYDSEANFGELANFGKLYYKIDPTPQEVQESLSTEYMIYFIGGHADYSFVDLGTKGGVLRANDLDLINSSLVAIGGCFTDCWFSGIFEDNNKLDYSSKSLTDSESWFSEKIFSSPNVKAMIVGSPNQAGKSFLSEAIPDLLKGKTIAESMINRIYSVGDSQTLIGDPAFHFNF